MAEIKIGSGIVAARVEYNNPSSYRLARRNGVLILQGAFQWQQGSDGGWTWRDIPTVKLEGPVSGVAVTQPLSPAAQAVLDHFLADVEISLKHGVAATLRAAVDQVVSSVPPPCADFDEHAKGFLAAHVKYRRDLLAIATELEGVSERPSS